MDIFLRNLDTSLHMKINFATGNEVEHNEYEIVILQRHIITSETINLFVWRNLN